MLLQLVNRERVSAGLGALESRGAIVTIASGQSHAMAARGDIWHNEAYLTSSTRSSLGAGAMGENVATNGSVDDAHRRLMASPGHRSNILDGRFDAVGISVVHDNNGRLFITQDFVDSKPAPRAAPSPRRRPGIKHYRPRPSKPRVSTTRR